MILYKLSKTVKAYQKSKFLLVVSLLMIAICSRTVASNVILFYRHLLNARAEGTLQQLCWISTQQRQIWLLSTSFCETDHLCQDTGEFFRTKGLTTTNHILASPPDYMHSFVCRGHSIVAAYCKFIIGTCHANFRTLTSFKYIHQNIVYLWNLLLLANGKHGRETVPFYLWKHCFYKGKPLVFCDLISKCKSIYGPFLD